MVPPRVSFVRSALLAVLTGSLAVPTAGLAATGGAGVPGGAQSAAPGTAEPAPAATPGAEANPPAQAPVVPSAPEQAQPATVDLPAPRLPVLASAARKASDPVPSDLAALASPSSVAAIDGHVIVVRTRMSSSELVDLADPERPRPILASTRAFGTPHVGRDAAGRAVVVASPCAGTEAVVRLGQPPRCPLRAIDVLTGTSRALPGSTGALAGDLAGDRLVFTRRSPSTGMRLYESVGGAAAQVVDLPALGTPGDGWTAASGVPLRGTLRAPAFDLDPAGRLAIVLEYAAKRPRHSSGLWLRDITGSWRRLTTIGTTFRGMGLRHVLGPQLDETGVLAYVEGVVEQPSFVARWDDDGTATLRQSVRRSIGRSTILRDAAYDAGRLVFVDWLPGAPCGAEEALACGLRALGPLVAEAPPPAAPAP